MQLEQHYRISEVAVMLDVTKDQVHAAIHTGELVAINVAKNPNGLRPRWRISESEMGKFLLKRRSPASIEREQNYRPIRRRRKIAV